MTDDRMSGLALIAGSFGFIITMSLHPSGRDLFVPGQLEPLAQLAVATHALALASLPVLFLGAFGLSQRLAAAGRLAMAALVMYAFAVVAAMNAAAVSGLVAPTLVREVLAASPSSSEAWRIAFDYNGFLNHAFALLFVVGSSVAIVLWSIAILRSATLARGVGTYGCILGPITLIAVLSGHLKLDVHGFGVVVFGQALWFIIVGALLCRIRATEYPSSHVPTRMDHP